MATTTNSMDPRLLSRGPSSLSFSGRNSDISKLLLCPRQDSSDPIRVGEESPIGARCRIPAPLDQFFRGAELGKSLMMLSGGAIGGFTALMAFHETPLPKQSVRAPVIVLLMIGFCSLLIGLPFQESCPEFAVVAVLVVGVPSVVAAFLTAVAAILPPYLDPFVWVVAGLMGAWLLFLLFVVQSKGMRARVHL